MILHEMKIIIFGARDGARIVKAKLEKQGIPFKIIAFADNDINLQKSTLFDKPIIDPINISSFEYDQIIISTQKYLFIKSIVEQLENECNVPKEKINKNFIYEVTSWEARLIALENTSQIINDNKISGEVAELGVFQGDFALHINKLFPKRKLYLFDTFEGFSVKDVKKDIEIGSSETIKDRKYDFTYTTENIVLSRMEYPENCVIKKGYFPETTKGFEEKFAFISLDADLYQPMLEGLKYFYPRLENGGYIFVHDFFHEDFTGTRKAVLEFNNMEKLNYVPLGDNCSIGIVKNRHFA